MAEKLAPEKRHEFVHNGQKVFEWDQTLEEVNMYIDLPQTVPKKLFYCKIQSKHIEVGIKGNPPYLNHDLSSPVKTDSSFWTLDVLVRNIKSIGTDKTTAYRRRYGKKSRREEERLFGRISANKKDEVMHVTLQKRDKGQTWASPILGQGGLDPYVADLEQKRLMLQRFQEENPGFDFSQAQFTGTCPDPRTFMGGIRND
ncbi:NudC domain-containing protein 2 [Rhynchospora pubera]|uniref:NudC domain-containing protein 2 n=1 Tax=Rhynchospora pubera TaxID=906938 RepID=A0AAV8E9Y9_9POAL|nr:NudC domain-containing protein 2 [Rhynchospora pubera]